MAMLEVKDINVYYGLIHALRDVSFEVNEGEVVARARRPPCTPSRVCSRPRAAR